MSNDEKIKLLERLLLRRGSPIDWVESYRQTFNVPFGIGLPSGLTGAEASIALARRVLEGKPVVLVDQSLERDQQLIQRYRQWLLA